ncbi:threonine/serine exporter family protein [Peribacillus asahii]|uniref:threonine/serine exporter family protein n=1 Tax=Peribacillus asahii TaxID=228899 RepID=UPI002079CB27|nr:threonine/serine exporter family protein [Peribacillus asahii]USK70243.1 threonine/serine exporter family protein [Peribacillus asahii]
MEDQRSLNSIIDVCLLAGKIMLENGAETYRVEDTMIRIASAFGCKESQSFSTPTGIIFSLDGDYPISKVIRISHRSTDLHKVTLVNSISRSVTNKELTVREAYIKLKELERANVAYPLWIQIFAAFISSGCFTIMFNGQWNDFIWACIAGGLGFACLLHLHRLLEVRFFAEFIASFVIGVAAFWFMYIGLGSELDKIIIGAVMPLVPGLLITNAARDLIAGHLVSGLAKGADAGLTALAIGAGIAVAFVIL